MPRPAARLAARWSASTRRESSARLPGTSMPSSAASSPACIRQAISRPNSARRCCCRTRKAPPRSVCSWPVSGRVPAFGRKQYRKALQSSAQAVLKTGSADAIVYLALEDVPDHGDGLSRARGRGSLFWANVQDSRLENRAEAETAQAREPHGGGGQRALGEVHDDGRQGRRGHRRGQRARPRSREPAPQRVHTDISRRARASALPPSGRASRPKCSTKPPSGA